jgi:hypothetical protein
MYFNRSKQIKCVIPRLGAFQPSEGSRVGDTELG